MAEYTEDIQALLNICHDEVLGLASASVSKIHPSFAWRETSPMMMMKTSLLKKKRQGGCLFRDSYDSLCDSLGPVDKRTADLEGTVAKGAFQLL